MRALGRVISSSLVRARDRRDMMVPTGTLNRASTYS
jgi:hypothetical protein